MPQYSERAVQAFADGFNDWERYPYKCPIINGVLYSYGRHFPLAWKAPKGSCVDYVINGDKYSVTTSSHQRDAIGMLKPNVQIPITACDAAGVDWRTMVIVDKTDDESWNECPDTGRRVEWDFGSHRYVDDKTDCPKRSSRGLGDAKWKPVWRHRLGSVLLRDQRGWMWLSSMDENEPAHLQKYFLCRLPSKRVRTVKEAYESLRVKATFSLSLQTSKRGSFRVHR
jgi:hypothetical protein